MNAFAIFDPGTGRITQAGQGNTASVMATVAEIPGNLSYMLSDPADDIDVDRHFILDGQVTERQPLSFPNQTITADGTDEALITGIPAGVSVTWPDGQTDEVADGEVVLAVDLPGTYVLRFTGVPYLDTEVTIEAVPAA